MNLSFAGCGFLGIYHVGVAVCFKKYAPHLLLDKISGASAGAIAACCLLCDLPLATFTSNVLKLAKEARKKTLGPFSPSFNVQAIMLDSLQKYLPHDAHIRVNGKLHVSLTRVYDGKNVIVSQFDSREDLLQALLASSFIPLFSGLLPPRFHGIRYMDGGFSDNLPTLDENTITISPFCGESDICPRDMSSQLFHVNFANTSIELSRQNIYRFARILFPPNPEILSNMCKQGFDDALRFLHRNNLINCTRCVAVQSTFVMSESLDDNVEYDPECDECKMHRQEALVANLPETVMTIFQDAIDSANKGIINWLFKHKSMKLLSILTLPYTLPADILYATVTKFLLNAPTLTSSLLELTRYFLEQLSMFFPHINIYYQPMSQTIKASIAISDNLPSYKTNCVINISDFADADDTFQNFLEVTSDQETLISYYYMGDEKKLTEIYDDSTQLELNPEPFPALNKFQYDHVPWDEPAWLSQHTLADNFNDNHYSQDDFEVHIDGDDDQQSFGLSDMSAEDSNILSDPESEWGIDIRPSECIFTFPASPDSRPEVDQPAAQ